MIKDFQTSPPETESGKPALGLFINSLNSKVTTPDAIAKAGVLSGKAMKENMAKALPVPSLTDIGGKKDVQPIESVITPTKQITPKSISIGIAIVVLLYFMGKQKRRRYI